MVYFIQHSGCNWISALVSSVTLLCEPKSRQMEIALFTLNKSMEVIYMMAKRRGYSFTIPFGEGLLLTSALTIICCHFFAHPEAFKGTSKQIMNIFFKDI